MRIALAVVLFAVLQTAHAENYFAGYLGGAGTQNSFLNIQQPGGTDLRFSNVSFAGRSWESPLYYGVRHGFFFIPHLGFETEFTHFKVFTDTTRAVPVSGTNAGAPVNRAVPLNTFVQRLNMSHGANLLTANLVGRKSLFNEPDHKLGRVLLTARVGFGITIPHAEYQVLNGLALEHYDAGKFAWQIAGGAEFRLWKGLYGLGEYKFSHAREDIQLTPGNAQTVLKSNHGVFGLAVHF
jgi:opacity protein-like surface antigen